MGIFTIRLLVNSLFKILWDKDTLTPIKAMEVMEEMPEMLEMLAMLAMEATEETEGVCSKASGVSVEEETTIMLVAIKTKEVFNNSLDKAIDSDH